jgi:hypothetical protein
MAGIQNKVLFSEGSKITPTSSGSRTDLQQTATEVSEFNYTGNPEGVISANPSSLCHDPVAGTVYKKNSGVGNTGWSVFGSSFAWTVIGANQALVINNGYICKTGGALLLSLPTSSSVGDIIEVTLDGSTSYRITQSAGQSIELGNQPTTTGVTGYVETQAQGDTVRMVCSVANLRWNVISSMGNLFVF